MLTAQLQAREGQQRQRWCTASLVSVLLQLAHLCATIGAPGCDMHACDTANPNHLDTLTTALLSRQVRGGLLLLWLRQQGSVERGATVEGRHGL